MNNQDDLVSVYEIQQYMDQFAVIHLLEDYEIPYIVQVHEVMGFPRIYGNHHIYGKVLVHLENRDRAKQIIEDNIRF